LRATSGVKFFGSIMNIFYKSTDFWLSNYSQNKKDGSLGHFWV